MSCDGVRAGAPCFAAASTAGVCCAAPTSMLFCRCSATCSLTAASAQTARDRSACACTGGSTRAHTRCERMRAMRVLAPNCMPALTASYLHDAHPEDASPQRGVGSKHCLMEIGTGSCCRLLRWLLHWRCAPEEITAGCLASLSGAARDLLPGAMAAALSLPSRCPVTNHGEGWLKATRRQTNKNCCGIALDCAAGRARWPCGAWRRHHQPAAAAASPARIDKLLVLMLAAAHLLIMEEVSSCNCMLPAPLYGEHHAHHSTALLPSTAGAPASASQPTSRRWQR